MGKKIGCAAAKQPKTDIFTVICKTDLKIEVVKELRFHEKRLWRFDYAIPDHKIAIEVEGGVYKKRTYKDKRTGETITTTGGRHNSSDGFINDIEKYNTGTLLGWRIFRVTPADLLKKATFDLIRQAILQ